MSDTRIPVTVLTGYLGAGKTTLLNRILGGYHGQRYAVIINEFGAVGIDHELITRRRAAAEPGDPLGGRAAQGADLGVDVLHSNEELFEMNNGCICCTVRGDLIRALHALLLRPEKLDAIIVETSGLADPGPVAQTFFVDPQLREKTRLDSITTLVDTHHIISQLASSREAAEQIAFADQIVLNKTDLANEAELQAVENALRRINPLAPLQRAQRSRVALHTVLGCGGFDLARIQTLEPDFLKPSHGDAAHVHDEHCGHDHHPVHHDHDHDAGITSASLHSTRPMDAARVQQWLATLLAEQGADILRAKGIIDVAGDERRMVFQSVHMILEGDWQRPWRANERRHSRLVFIGRKLDAAALQASFDACAASAKTRPVQANPS